MNLTGCNQLNDNEKLLHPPKFSGEYQTIYEALKSSVPFSKISLQSPKAGKHRSAITTYTSSIDKAEYAIAFYKSGLQKIDSKNSLRMGILQKSDEIWRCAWDIPCEGEDIDQIMFMENGEKNNLYLIVGYASSQSVQNKYYIYNLNIKNFKTIYSGEYNMMAVCDVDSDGNLELITIGNYEKSDIDTKNYDISNNISDSKDTTRAIIHSISQNHVTLWGDAKMSPYYQKYTKISIDQKTFKSTSLFVDSQRSNEKYSTEILIFADNKLKNLTYENDLFVSSSRSYAPFSCDIDNDGEIEIPQTKPFPGYQATYSNEQNSPLPYITTWRKYQDKKLVKIFDTYLNHVYGFGIKLPNSWQNKVSIKQIYEDDEIEFFIYDNSDDNLNDSKRSSRETLFKIKVEHQKNKSALPKDYFILKSEGPLIYLASLNQPKNSSNSQLFMTMDQLKESFFIIRNV